MEDKRSIVGRIKIDLSEFFHDERRFCYKSLDLDVLGRVGDLKTFLRRELGISVKVSLMLGNCALFDTDNIRVLRDGDQVRVVQSRTAPETNSVASGFPGTSNVAASDNQSCSSSDSTPNAKMNGARSHDVDNLNNEILEEGLEWMKEPLPKRKRTRKRRGKKSQENGREPEKVEERPVRVFRPPRCKVNPPSDRKHFRFDEESSMDHEDVPEHTSTNGFSHPPCREPFVKAEENLQNLLVPQQPVVFKRQFNPQPPVRDECKENVYYGSLSDQTIFDLPALTEKPKVDEVIAYRVLFVGENYTPELSSWLVARVMSDGPEGLGLQLLRGINPAVNLKDNKFDIEEKNFEEREDFMTSPFEELAMARLVPPEPM